jgi:hypothetical protein
MTIASRASSYTLPKRALSDGTGGTIGEKMSGFYFPIDYL